MRITKQTSPEIKREAGPQRDAKGRFVSGSSGNAGGRPRESEETRDAKRLLLKATPEAVELLLRMMRNPHAKDEVRVRCAETVLDRVYGKAAQPIDGSLGAKIEIVMDGLEELSG